MWKDTSEVLCVRMPRSEIRCVQRVTIPVSQLVLPVGVTGLTVNGNTPTPEPGGAVAMEVVSLGKVGEDTHRGYVWYGKNTFHHRMQTPAGGESVHCRHAHCTRSRFLLHHQSVSQGTESHVRVTRSSEIRDSNP